MSWIDKVLDIKNQLIGWDEDGGTNDQELLPMTSEKTIESFLKMKFEKVYGRFCGGEIPNKEAASLLFISLHRTSILLKRVGLILNEKSEARHIILTQLLKLSIMFLQISCNFVILFNYNLILLLTIAFFTSILMEDWFNEATPIEFKTHQRKAISIFCYGLYPNKLDILNMGLLSGAVTTALIYYPR